MDTFTSTQITQPTRRMDHFQAMHKQPARKRRKIRVYTLILLLLVIAYFLAPIRTNILLLGTDDSPERGNVGRTDSIILASIVPLEPYIGMLSIPRDLWVTIPNVGEQRINTAYFFAEANQPGTGSEAAMETIRRNFGVPVRYHIVIHMSGMAAVVDALGGIDVQLNTSTNGFPAGTHHLNGTQALALARDRSASDDFSRMASAQVLISASLAKLMQPTSWQYLPQFVVALSRTVETNIPLWQYPRLLFVLLRAPLSGVDSRAITREMVDPFVTSQGAQVLLPNRDAIQSLIQNMFGRQAIVQ